MSKHRAKHKPAAPLAPERPAAPIAGQATAWVPSRALIGSLCLFAFALAIRGLHFFYMRHTLLYEVLICDAWQYDDWAQRIAGGQWMGSEVFYQTPLYPYLLGVIYSLAGHSVWAVRIAQAVLGSLACVFLAQSGRHFFSPKVGWISGVLLAAYPPAIFFDGILQKATLDLFLVTALLWSLGALQSQLRAWRCVLAGALLGLLILNRENAALLAPVLLAWLVWLSWPESGIVALARAAALVAGLLVMLLPVGARNWHVGGEFLLTTSQFGPNFFMGNNRAANGQHDPLRPGRADPRFEREDARLLAEQAAGRALTPSEVSRYWVDRTLTDITDDPARWLRLMAWKLYLVFNTIELVDGEGIRVHQQFSPILWSLGWFLSFGVLVPLAVLGLWFTRRDWRRLVVLYAMLLAFALALILFFILARYRIPMVPIAMLFAAAGLLGLLERVRARTTQAKRELWIGLALAVPAAVISNWPLTSMYNDEVTYFNVGTALMDLGRSEEAIEPLLKSKDFNRPLAYNNLGSATLATGDVEGAEKYFLEAIKADPTYYAPYFALATIAERRHDLPQAVKYLEKAIALDPLQSVAERRLGRIKIGMGDTQGALEHLRRFVAMNETSPAAHNELGVLLLSEGELAAGVAELRKAMQLKPRSIMAANNLAWILATAPDDKLRNGKEAVALAKENAELTANKQPELLGTLAAALAETGQFDEAIAQATHGIELAKQDQNDKLVASLETALKRYQAHEPFRDESLTPSADKPAATPAEPKTPVTKPGPPMKTESGAPSKSP